MEVFKHIVITRFNLSQRWATDKTGQKVLGDKWLADRYILFENYCLPSIKSQTNQNFEWWVYFDNTTNEYFRKKNSELHAIYPNFKPKYESSYDDFEENMPKEISSYLKDEGVDWLITTRLDNDDIFAIDTIDIIQKSFSQDNMHIIEMPIGLTMEIGNKTRLRKIRRLGNPFISLSENISMNDGVRGVYYHQHNQWKNNESKFISDRAQWIQVIHENNISNTAYGEEVLHIGISNRFKFKRDNIIFQNIFEFSRRKILFKLEKFYYKVKRKLRSIYKQLNLENKY